MNTLIRKGHVAVCCTSEAKLCEMKVKEDLVNANGVSMTNRLVTAILDWPVPKTIPDVQSWQTITVYLSTALLEYFSLFRTYFEEEFRLAW